MKNNVLDEVKRFFRPEFLNRIDDIIIFHPLTQEQIISIVDLMVKDVQGRLSDRGITFELTPGASRWLAEEGFDPVFGARPLRRAVQRNLENPLSKGILGGEFLPGDHVIGDLGDSGLTLAKAAVAQIA